MWRGWSVMAVAMLGLVVVSCGGDGDGGVTAGDVRGVVSVDRRPELLAELGAPDAFVISVDEVDGSVSRFESWSYFPAGVQIDLVDGEVVWSVQIDELPDGSLLPLAYQPTEFTMLASRAETMAVLEGVELEVLSSSADVEVDGAELWAGEQLLLAFVEDRLVYVETYPLAPVAPEVAS